IKSTANLKVKKLSVDGGLTQNHFLMQFQADILGIPVELPQIQEMTAFGAAGMAGITSGFWSKEEFQSLKKIKHIFNPVMEKETSDKLYSNWKRAVSKSLNWEE
ncbi:MAG: FGGY-family carbohydrate kinase, partial [bacterium]|nr:FGGY-family carbohydrate kinase [bacterium]